MNNIVLIGRLTADPELKYLQGNGTAVTRFALAVNKDLSKDKKEEFERTGKSTADFPRVQVWGKQAENCAKYLKKGRLIAIRGRIQTGSYESEGRKVYTTDVVAEKVQFLEYGDKQQQTQGSYGDGFDYANDEDIPF